VVAWQDFVHASSWTRSSHLASAAVGGGEFSGVPCARSAPRWVQDVLVATITGGVLWPVGIRADRTIEVALASAAVGGVKVSGVVASAPSWGCKVQVATITGSVTWEGAVAADGCSLVVVVFIDYRDVLIDCFLVVVNDVCGLACAAVGGGEVIVVPVARSAPRWVHDVLVATIIGGVLWPVGIRAL